MDCNERWSRFQTVILHQFVTRPPSKIQNFVMSKVMVKILARTERWAPVKGGPSFKWLSYIIFQAVALYLAWYTKKTRLNEIRNSGMSTAKVQIFKIKSRLWKCLKQLCKFSKCSLKIECNSFVEMWNCSGICPCIRWHAFGFWNIFEVHGWMRFPSRSNRYLLFELTGDSQ